MNGFFTFYGFFSDFYGFWIYEGVLYIFEILTNFYGF